MAEIAFITAANLYEKGGMIGLSPNTKRRYGDSLVILKRKFRGKKMCWNKGERVIGLKAIKTFLRERIKTVTYSTCKTDMTVASNICEYVQNEEEIDIPNPFKGVKLRRQEIMLATNPPRHWVITDTQEKKLLLALPQPLTDMAKFSLETGLRKGELIGLTWDRIDIYEHLIYFHPGNHKSANYKECAISPEATQILLSQTKHIDPHVFTLNKTVVSPHWFRRIWRESLKKAGIEERPEYGKYGKRLRVHDLRHACGQRLRDRGEHPHKIQAQLRHSELKTTERVYALPSGKLAKTMFYQST